jgi:Tfp pilus assembly protein PilX
MAKFHRDEDDRDEFQPRPRGSNSVLIVVLMMLGGFGLILILGAIGAMFLFSARAEVREAELVQEAEMIKAEAAAIEAEMAVQAEAAKESESVRDYKAKVAHFLTEARAGAKMLAHSPSHEDVKAKSKHITDLYTRLPDVPSEIDSTGDLAKNLVRIKEAFSFAEITIRQRDEFVRLNSREGMEKATFDLGKTSYEVKSIANDIEAKLATKTEAKP